MRRIAPCIVGLTLAVNLGRGHAACVYSIRPPITRACDAPHRPVYSRVDPGGQPCGGQPCGGQPCGGQPCGGQPCGGQPCGGQPCGGQPWRSTLGVNLGGQPCGL